MKHRRKGYKYIRLGHCNNPVGYCHYHHSIISKTQMDSKQCLEKQCKAFERYEDHDFWKQYDKAKAKTKANRLKKKKYFKEEEGVKVKMKTKLYCATLHKDCTPHYFAKLDNAMEYITKDQDIDTPIWHNNGNTWDLEEIGWIVLCIAEDE